MEQPVVEVTKLLVGDDPTISIFSIEISTSQGIWRETFGTPDLLRAFIRGLQAAYGVNGSFPRLPVVTMDAWR